jgi:hypothetical protein
MLISQAYGTNHEKCHKKLILEKDEQVSPDLFLPRKHGFY